MELLPGIVADGCALYLEAARALVLSDLHIGYEEEMRRKGVLLPQEQRDFFAKELDRLIAAYRPRTVVLAGDVKHEFGRISQEEWSDVLRLIRGVRRRGCDVAVVGGNHDMLIKPILDKLAIPLQKALIIMSPRPRTNVLIVHGDEDLDSLKKAGIVTEEDLAGVSVILMGHEHPALTITDGVRAETVKCFLVGEFRAGRRRYGLVVLPSFNPLVAGTMCCGSGRWGRSSQRSVDSLPLPFLRIRFWRLVA